MERHKHEPGIEAEDDAGTIVRSLRVPEAFGVLFNRHAPTIHRYLARPLGPATADDLVAETFLAAFRRRHRYDLARMDARPWLYGIATKLIGQHHRDEAREVRLLQAIPADRNEFGLADRVVADVSARAMRTTLIDALATLTPDDRDVLLLIAWEDLSYHEVATALAIPIGTVRSRLSRARRRIREALKDMAPNEPLRRGLPMDGIALVRELVPAAPLPDLEELSTARSLLFDAVKDSSATRPRRTRRLLIAGLATAAAAAALTAVLVLAPDLIGDELPQANAQAALILHRAADAALLAPELQPRPDQFLYTDNGDGYESWYSVDGTRDGMAQGPSGREVFPGCRNGQRATLKGDQVIGTEPCSPDPAYLPDLPTDAGAMLQYIYREYAAEPGDANAIGKGILFLIKDHYLRPQARAAVFDAAAAVPGLSVIAHTTDGVGRPGVGIAWSTDGKSGMIVFDPETFAYLGYRQGEYASAEVRVAIVDAVGQRP